MATKKETMEPAVQAVTKEEYLKENVRIKVRKPEGVQAKGTTVAVNDHTFFVPYGEVVEVPRYIALVLENTEMQDEKTERLIMSLAQ